VNRAWERITGISAAEARGLVCPRRAPAAQDPKDVVVRCLCCPPAEVLEGKCARARRVAPGSSRSTEWWELDFWPLRDEAGLLCVLGKISMMPPESTSPSAPLPDKLTALRVSKAARFGLEHLASTLPAMQRLQDQVRLVSRSIVPALVLGEPGTGKRWIAQAIHYQSAQSDGAFVCLDCARLPATVLDRILLERAPSVHARTIYLRNLPSLPRDLQASVRDRLESITGDASSDTLPRILAGSSVDTLAAVRAGTLLETLHYALSAVVLTLPPLRERLDDLPALVAQLLPRASSNTEHPVTGISPAALEIIRAYSWPGNLQELYAVLRSACIQATNGQIDVGHLPSVLRLMIRLEETPAPEPDKPLPLDQLLEQAERRLIVQALRRARGNRSQAAELLSIWRPRLLRRMEALGITDW
jgi:DNA-binding NtrC family response regulator